jgi:endoglucanase
MKNTFRVLLTVFAFVSAFSASSQVIYSDNFAPGFISTFSSPNGFSHQFENNNLQITGNGGSGLYAAMNYQFHNSGVKTTINASTSPKIYIKAKGENNVVLRADFQDDSGYVTNKNPIQYNLTNDYKIYEYNYTNNLFDGAYGGSPCTVSGCPVNPAKLSNIILFANPASGGYSGKIDIDWISIGAPFEVISAANDYTIRYNQVGYFKGETKTLSIVAPGTFGNFDYSIVEKSSGLTVKSGKVINPVLWSSSNDYVFNIDFTNIDKEGVYVVNTPNVKKEITISTKTYSEIGKAAIKYFYYNRATIALDVKYAGVWARPLGHPETNVQIHTSAATAQRPAGTVITSPKGWYDAGDYNKYIVNSGISTYTLLAAYEHYPTYFNKLALSIPEEGGNLPDILDEALWNIDWMLTMQDPNDGGVYHKCTDLDFSGEVMPHQSNAQRYVVAKSTAAALNFAAVMAVSSRIFAKFNNVRPGFSDQLKEAAVKAYNWAKANPAIYFRNPSGVNTGEYGDGNTKDEFEWAAAELLITTRDVLYKNDLNINNIGGGVAAWPYTSPLASISLNYHQEAIKNLVDASPVNAKILQVANQLKQTITNSSMKVAMSDASGDFVWGSNGQAGNQIIMLIRAYEISKDTTYLNAAYTAMDYLLGRNGTGYCYVTGFGATSTFNPHHRPSRADGVFKPIPGMLAGGPNPGRQDGCPGYLGNEPAKSYVDTWCSYASNEVAINWNAPLAYALNALEYYHEFKQELTNTNPNSTPTKLRIYPNPSFDKIRLTTFTQDAYEYNLLTLEGKRLWSGVLSRNQFIDISKLPIGSYCLNLKSKEGIQTLRFVKMK